MRDEIELIHNPYKTSFICSFGYKILYVEKKTDNMDDIYFMKHEDGRSVVVTRKNFFEHVKKTFGGVKLTRRKPKLNPLIMYDMF